VQVRRAVHRRPASRVPPPARAAEELGDAEFCLLGRRSPPDYA